MRDKDGARFWSRVRVNAVGCPLTWMSDRAPDSTAVPYGRFAVGGSTYYAHRIAASMAEDVTGKVVMHSCDNPECVTPDHLSAGSQGDNVRDRDQKGRSGSAKLSFESVADIRSQRKAGVSVRAISEYYGVTVQTIYYAVSRSTWSTVEETTT